jgi:hypothetical protein
MASMDETARANAALLTLNHVPELLPDDRCCQFCRHDLIELVTSGKHDMKEFMQRKFLFQGQVFHIGALAKDIHGKPI